MVEINKYNIIVSGYNCDKQIHYNGKISPNIIHIADYLHLWADNNPFPGNPRILGIMEYPYKKNSKQNRLFETKHLKYCSFT